MHKKDARQDISSTTCTSKLTAIKFSNPPNLDFFPALDLLLSASDTRRRHDARRSDEIFMVLQWKQCETKFMSRKGDGLGPLG